MTKGWYGNRQAHSLASKGIKTKGDQRIREDQHCQGFSCGSAPLHCKPDCELKPLPDDYFKAWDEGTCCDRDDDGRHDYNCQYSHGILKAKGLKWKHKVNINQHTWDWDEDTPVSDVASKVAKDLRVALQEMREKGIKFKNLPNYIIDEEELDYLENDLIEQFESMGDDVTPDDFDFYLEDLYNWADANRVWLG